MKNVSKEIIEGNRQIHMYMGWDMMTNQEIFDYEVSMSRIGREKIDVDEWVKKISNLPDMKRRGVVITNTSHNDIFYSEILNYHHSLDSLIPVLEKITKEYYHYNDMFDTIEILLRNENDKSLVFSVENIWSRIIRLLSMINQRI
jgi:hypothetical protein